VPVSAAQHPPPPPPPPLQPAGAGAGGPEASGGAGHKTAPVQQTGEHVVGSIEEAGHRMQEQQGADNPGGRAAAWRACSAAEAAAASSLLAALPLGMLAASGPWVTLPVCRCDAADISCRRLLQGAGEDDGCSPPRQ
jgi:hypothetical protein